MLLPFVDQKGHVRHLRIHKFIQYLLHRVRERISLQLRKETDHKNWKDSRWHVFREQRAGII